MAEISSYDEGTPCWVDLMTPDLDLARRFYTEVFGWDYIDTGELGGGYLLATLNGKMVAGIGPGAPGQPAPPSVWTTYLWSDDTDATVDRIKAAGGSVTASPMDVPNAGRMAVVADSTGAVFGLWQGREHGGAQVGNEPGAFTWNENLNDDPAAARAFYQKVFGYTYESFPDAPGAYEVFKVKNEIRGGIGAKPEQMPKETPNFWNTYFSVTDTDDAVAAVSKNGGTVVMGPSDTPVGRMAVAVDPPGAQFCVIATPPQQA